ncbi:uncharacterized protein [Mytilus edulis]|uniref:uncharacterized protein n=1 Tax=Mytilus edulis TaxID=6550 RepID=UPI0039F0035A
MADPVIQTAEQQITCTICFDIFDEPKSLPCLHTFCKKCIGDHILHHSEFARRMGYHCPICRGFVLAPTGKEFSPHLWVESLPNNHNIVSMISAYTTPRPYYLNPCAVHPNKELEFYCVDHELYICSLCSLQHRKCDEVLSREEAEDLPRKVTPSTDSTEERYISYLFDQCNDIEHLMDSRKGILSRIDQSEEEIKSRITTTSRKATDLIKSQEEKVISQLSKLKSKEVHKIESDIRKCQKANEKCKRSLQSLQEARDKEDAEDMTNTLENVKKEYEANSRKIRELSRKSFRSTIDFQMNSSIENFITDFQSFGSVDFIRDDGIPQTPCSTSSGSASLPTPSQRCPRPSKSATSRRRDFSPNSSCPSFGVGGDRDDRPRTVQSQRIRSASSVDYAEARGNSGFYINEGAHIEVSQHSKQPSWITGIAILDNGNVVVVDHANETVSLYDTTYVKVSEIVVTPAPYDTTTISNTELLVTRPDIDTLLAINVYGQGELKYGASFQTGLKAKSISHDNSHLAVCSSTKLQIYVKHNGRWRKHEEHSFDRTKFTYVAIDGVKERIFITDQKYPEPELLCLTYDGDIRWRFMHPDLGFPSGVALCSGHIYVASWDRATVLRVAYNGLYEGTGIQRGIQFPWKLTVTSRHNKLLLSQHKNTLATEARRIIRFFSLDAEM